MTRSLVTAEDFLNAVDVVSVFGNLLDNAIEACVIELGKEKVFLEIELSEDPK